MMELMILLQLVSSKHVKFDKLESGQYLTGDSGSCHNPHTPRRWGIFKEQHTHEMEKVKLRCL